MTRRHCSTCYQLYTPRDPERLPSGICDRCFVEVTAALSQPSPDFTPANCKRITFIPEVFYEH